MSQPNQDGYNAFVGRIHPDDKAHLSTSGRSAQFVREEGGKNVEARAIVDVPVDSKPTRDGEKTGGEADKSEQIGQS